MYFLKECYKWMQTNKFWIFWERPLYEISEYSFNWLLEIECPKTVRFMSRSGKKLCYAWSTIMLHAEQLLFFFFFLLLFSFILFLIWAYSFVKKRRRVFAPLFGSIFLRNWSLSNISWFFSKNKNLGTELCI